MKALVVGYGSIGQRHARLLKEMGLDVAVVSRRAIEGPARHADLAVALEHWQPGYVVVADETRRHAHTLGIIAAAGFAGRLLVEKPLFDHPQPLPAGLPEQSYVAYNLRFHPLLQALKQRLDGQRLISLSAYVGQYLPDWRPGTDYRQCYSAKRAEGGGVLRDLSHELDYLCWLAGGWSRATAQGGHLSGLEIDSDDLFDVLFHAPGGTLVNARLNYLDRKLRRDLLVHTDAHSYRLDFVAGTLACDADVETLDVPRDVTYLSQHQAILSGDAASLCTLAQGQDVMALIAAAEAASQDSTWKHHD